MRIALFASHVGSEGIRPSGQHGGGELYTFACLQILSQYYDTLLVVPNGRLPDLEGASQYGLNMAGLPWRPLGDNADWLRQFDVFIGLNHAFFLPPMCRRNILSIFFPQYPDWDTTGYDTLVTISKYSAKWVKNYWGRDAEIVSPPIPVDDIITKTAEIPKKKVITCVGRFFEVPGGNNKNHLVVLKLFQRMKLPDWQLHFVGAVQNQRYYQTIRQSAYGDDRIFFHHNISRDEYLDLLGQSTFLWAATGYGADKPSSQEHFGIIAVEAMAAGAIPIVHESGGTPEVGCLTWEKPDELIGLTKDLIADPDVLQMGGEANREMAKNDWSLRAQAPRLLEVIEKPVKLFHNPQRTKLFVSKPRPDEIKAGMLSDSLLTTGFGVVTEQVGLGLREKGYNVVLWGMQDPHLGRPHYDDPFPIWRGCQHDPNGWHTLEAFIRSEEPDVLYLNYDPGNVRFMLDRLRGMNIKTPIVAYIPIEGSPVIDQQIETLRLIKVLNGEPILYTKWAQQAVLESGGPLCQYIYHGCDHADFRALPPEERLKLRSWLGWENKFVCMFVGRNKRTKGFGHLLETAKILKDSGHSDIMWYLHTNPHEDIGNSSTPLDMLVRDLGIQDVVMFAPDLDDQTRGVEYDEPRQMSVPDTDDLAKVRRYAMASMSMIERYNVADVFVNASEVEGFGLPSLEAMGCWLPVVSVDDQGVQREALGGAPLYVPVKHWDRWHTAARLAQADPEDLAQAILAVKNDAKLRMELSEASHKRWEQFKWADVVEKISQVILDRVQL
jgi:glycosyltransferase involved in cell wall biosynthesis